MYPSFLVFHATEFLFFERFKLGLSMGNEFARVHKLNKSSGSILHHVTEHKCILQKRKPLKASANL